MDGGRVNGLAARRRRPAQVSQHGPSHVLRQVAPVRVEFDEMNEKQMAEAFRSLPGPGSAAIPNLDVSDKSNGDRDVRQVKRPWRTSHEASCLRRVYALVRSTISSSLTTTRGTPEDERGKVGGGSAR